VEPATTAPVGFRDQRCSAARPTLLGLLVGPIKVGAFSANIAGKTRSFIRSALAEISKLLFPQITSFANFGKPNLKDQI
jgi:hypothetical protein